MVELSKLSNSMGCFILKFYSWLGYTIFTWDLLNYFVHILCIYLNSYRDKNMTWIFMSICLYKKVTTLIYWYELDYNLNPLTKVRLQWVENYWPNKYKNRQKMDPTKKIVEANTTPHKSFQWTIEGMGGYCPSPLV
jgi:hypothetical protein